MVSQWVCAHSTGVISVIWQKKKKRPPQLLLSLVCLHFLFLHVSVLFNSVLLFSPRRKDAINWAAKYGGIILRVREVSQCYLVSQIFTFVWNISANIYNLTHFVKILHPNSDPVAFPVKNWILYHKKIHTDIYYININLCWNWQS